MEDFRCFSQTVSVERVISVEQFRLQRVEVLTDILEQLTWAFWQSNADHPTARLRQNIETLMGQIAP